MLFGHYYFWIIRNASTEDSQYFDIGKMMGQFHINKIIFKYVTFFIK
jgi:hypothetical protein